MSLSLCLIQFAVRLATMFSYTVSLNPSSAVINREAKVERETRRWRRGRTKEVGQSEILRNLVVNV